MTSRIPTITRRVHFFRLAHAEEHLPLLPDCLRAIDGLPWVGQGRYQPDTSDDSLLSVLPHSFEYPLRIEFGRTRRDNLPAIERGGIKKTLSIAEDAGLIDVCHIVIFADGFVAAEFNRDAPRLKKLGEYLLFKGKNLLHTPRFQRLFERDVAELIEQMADIRFLEIEIPTDNIGLLKQADANLYAALEAQKKVNSSKTVGVYFNSRNPEDGILKRIAINLMDLIKRSDQDRDIEKLKIKGTDSVSGKSKFLDLLEDYLIADVEFRKPSHKARSIDSASAFEAIEAAYIQRKDAIANAARGTGLWRD